MQVYSSRVLRVIITLLLTPIIVHQNCTLLTFRLAEYELDDENDDVANYIILSLQFDPMIPGIEVRWWLSWSLLALLPSRKQRQTTPPWRRGFPSRWKSSGWPTWSCWGRWLLPATSSCCSWERRPTLLIWISGPESVETSSTTSRFWARSELVFWPTLTIISRKYSWRKTDFILIYSKCKLIHLISHNLSFFIFLILKHTLDIEFMKYFQFLLIPVFA